MVAFRSCDRAKTVWWYLYVYNIPMWQMNEHNMRVYIYMHMYHCIMPVYTYIYMHGIKCELQPKDPATFRAPIKWGFLGVIRCSSRPGIMASVMTSFRRIPSGLANERWRTARSALCDQFSFVISGENVPWNRATPFVRLLRPSSHLEKEWYCFLLMVFRSRHRKADGFDAIEFHSLIVTKITVVSATSSQWPKGLQYWIHKYGTQLTKPIYDVWVFFWYPKTCIAGPGVFNRSTRIEIFSCGDPSSKADDQRQQHEAFSDTNRGFWFCRIGKGLQESRIIDFISWDRVAFFCGGRQWKWVGGRSSTLSEASETWPCAFVTFI